ncbi:glycosyltransferase family 2 protein [Aureobasidium sp. EXF-10727]|nr:glycosyltransferase family 2 protein [Aureobasidium sp. EXF-10727]KAI4724319.1 glycosyltransferase family 2 protein [Aureobasidium sp. EXF-10728]
MADEFKGGKAAKSGLKEVFSKLDYAVKYSSNWVFEWTPFILTICYWVASITFYVSCDEGTIKGFYYFFMVINFYIAACTVIEAFLGISPLRDARAAAIRVNACGEFPTPDDLLPILDIVIVAYLPNEQDIVKDQVNYALEEIVYPRDKLRINLLYNTPKPIEPLETELLEMEKQHGGLLRVTKVVGSKSKADNLNFFFTLDTGAEIIAVFDCDHFPHPYNARWAAERFIADPTVDIVQGRCIVYNSKETFFTRMIALEFDKIYAVSHPGRSRLFSFGLFCGSNGYWKAELLRGHQMHGHMLCEDIDSALRAYGEGKRAVHDMNVKSYEMAPTFWMAFWKQRMRWTQGWTQASIRHAHMIWDNPPNGTRCLSERYGLLSLIIVREMSYYLVTQHTCLLFSFLITGWPHNSGELARLIFFRYALSEWFLFLTVGSLIVTLWITEIVRSEFTSFYDMILFSAIYVPYLILQGTMGIYGHFREIIGYSSWNPTSRK